MPISPDLAEELNILARYKLTSTQEGIKVHNTAAPELIAAIKRLHDKDLLSRDDGGYLTDLGIETAEHVQKALLILNSK
ncbi:MAG: TIGR02647 family protein [Methyloprofundus sp.]|nr:TIGR02647 family protein [Methyloprofundus sp.]